MTSLLQKINDLDLRIDNITTQVCFVVSRGSGTVVNADTILPYNNISHNVGGGFDSTTHTLHVQFKDGIYFRLVSIQMEIIVML
jgi:hypothetical protein